MSRKRSGISGVFVALIIFSLLFTVGANYFLFVNRANLAMNQSNAARQDALLQGRQENLAINVGLSASNTLVVSAINVGGVSTTISSIYLANITGKVIVPPPASTNFSAPGSWPLTLNVGAATNSMSGCVALKTGCNIEVKGYTYVSGTLLVKVLTGRGNIFSARFPPASNSGVGGNTLVVSMIAGPSKGYTQIFTCNLCITLNVTAFNFASSPVMLASLNPTVPANSTTGTAKVSGGTCGLPSPSSTIPAYSGSGTAPSIRFTCTFNSNTGNVGGFASFSGFVQGKLSGALISSSEAVSNDIQIGGNSNVPTQGAFSVNFFYFRSSSCHQSIVVKWAPPCSTTPSPWPPASINSLPGAATISVGNNAYVAFYVQITNNFPATLDILKYTFLQLDASHPPPTVGNESDFWIAGDVNTYNSKGYSFPTYGNPPALVAYTGNEVSCVSVPANCIDIAQGQSVTLTLAACGFGSTNWDWGGWQDARNFDSSNGCTSSAPSFSPSGSANILTLVISFLWQNTVYTQDIQYQGLAVTP
ncbi:MAG: hypothetical protein OK452_03645 [Thaumarchaeota archaeon]|nr:hypothetical protein [Nitrososphaerota archaeon]